MQDDPALKRAEEAQKERTKALEEQLQAEGRAAVAPVEEPKSDEKPAAEQAPEPVETPATTPEQAPEGEPAAVEGKEVQPAKGTDERVTALTAKIDELTRKLTSRDGTHGNEKREWDRQLQDLRAQNALLVAEMERLRSSTPKAEPDKGKAKEEFDAYVQQFIKSNPDVAAEYEEADLRSFLRLQRALGGGERSQTDAELRKELDSIKAANARREHDEFTRQVETMAPGFSDANGVYDADGRPVKEGKDPKWFAFLSSPMNPAISDETWSEYAQRIGTPQAFAGVFKAYATANPSGAATEPDESGLPRPSLADQAAPRARAANPQRETQKVLRKQDYDRLRVRLASPGRVPTADETKQLREYEVASLEGRLQ